MLDLGSLRENLTNAFNDSELKNLCQDLNIDYQNLGGTTKKDMARELIEYCKRRGTLDSLAEKCQELRPNLNWLALQPKEESDHEVGIPHVKGMENNKELQGENKDLPASISNVIVGRDAIIAGRDLLYLFDDRQGRAERKTDEGRRKVQEWGERMSLSGWDDQAWHLLGFALQFVHEAVEIDSYYQRAWTLMADIYHRIGKEELAKECLKKSYSLAKLGPNFPGRFFKDVERNIESGYPFNNVGRLKRQSPPTWFINKYQRYWKL